MLLEIEGLSSHYGRIRALHGIGACIEEGELVALVGANGAGKTTLLRCISGIQASSGSIRFDGEELARSDPGERVRRGIVQVPEGRQVFGPMSVEDNLLLGAYTRPAGARAQMRAMYAMFPVLEERRRQPAGFLSGGEQQMLAMARALMSRPRLLLLDEPSMGLAPFLVARIFQAIADLKAQGTTIFLVEQNAQAALAIAERGYVLETGEIVLSDTGRALLADRRVREAYLGV